MRILPIVLFSVACSVTSPNNSTQAVDSTVETDLPRLQEQELEPRNLDSAHFYSHDPQRAEARDPLALDEFNVSIATAPGTLRTRIDVVIRNPSKAQKQARIRVPIPSNAAVTEAILYVGDKPMRGAFLGAKRAEQVYKSYTQRRRDPLLAVWGGPDWVDLQIFPVEGEQTRRFQLEWVEPRVTGGERHRLPVLANAGQVVGWAKDVLLDGQSTPSKMGVVSLQSPAAGSIANRRPGAAFGYVLAPGERPRDSALVLVAETSARMKLKDRAKQRQDIELVLAKLPAGTRVTLLSADWLTKNIAVDKSPEVVMAALGDLDDIISAGALDLDNTFADASALAKQTGAHSMVFFGQGVSVLRQDASDASTRALRAEAVSLFVITPNSVSHRLTSMATQTQGRILSADDPHLAQFFRNHGEPPKVPGVAGWTLLESLRQQPMWIGHFLGARPTGSTLGSAADLGAIWARSRVHAHGPESVGSSEGGVLTPSTSILVLESNAEYQRWGIPVPSAVVESLDNPVKQIAAQGARPAMPTDFSSGSDDRDIYGGLLGNAVGEMQGGWGYGISGVGPGGGATGWGTIGTGNYGTIGHGWGTGSGLSTTRGHKAQAPIIRLGNLSASEGLHETIIRRYIRRKLPRLRHCFEKELLVKPDLSGTVVSQFQIAPAGNTQGASSKGIGNGNVQSCVATAIKSIKFPKPKDGSHVNVRAALTFSNGYATPKVAWPMEQAIAAYEKSDKSERLQVVSQELGVNFESEAMLAWWILKEREQRFSAPMQGVVLAAMLLHDAGDDWNSRRVLSQMGFAAPKDTATQQRDMGFAADAQRMAALYPSVVTHP
jgi:hypothetical protein